MAQSARDEACEDAQESKTHFHESKYESSVYAEPSSRFDQASAYHEDLVERMIDERNDSISEHQDQILVQQALFTQNILYQEEQSKFSEALVDDNDSESESFRRSDAGGSDTQDLISEHLTKEPAVPLTVEEKAEALRQNHSAVCIQRWFLKFRRERLRNLLYNKIQNVQTSLAFRLNSKTLTNKRRARDTEIMLRTLTPKCLQWAINEGYFAKSWSEKRATAHSAPGVCVFLDLKGYSSITTELSKQISAREEGSVFFDVKPRNSDHGKASGFLVKSSADSGALLMSEVVNKYWELVVANVHQHNGDVVNFCGDGLQIIFPLVPNFLADGASASQVTAAERKCKRQAVLFAMDLMKSLTTFKLDSRNFSVSKLALKIGMAYGTSDFCVLGGICDRYEFVLTGDSVARASALSEYAHDKSNVVVIDETIADAVGSPLEAGQKFAVIGYEESTRGGALRGYSLPKGPASLRPAENLDSKGMIGQGCNGRAIQGLGNAVGRSDHGFVGSVGPINDASAEQEATSTVSYQRLYESLNKEFKSDALAEDIQKHNASHDFGGARHATHPTYNDGLNEAYGGATTTQARSRMIGEQKLADFRSAIISRNKARDKLVTGEDILDAPSRGAAMAFDGAYSSMARSARRRSQRSLASSPSEAAVLRRSSTEIIANWEIELGNFTEQEPQSADQAPVIGGVGQAYVESLKSFETRSKIERIHFSFDHTTSTVQLHNKRAKNPRADQEYVTMACKDEKASSGKSSILDFNKSDSEVSSKGHSAAVKSDVPIREHWLSLLGGFVPLSMLQGIVSFFGPLESQSVARQVSTLFIKVHGIQERGGKVDLDTMQIATTMAQLCLYSNAGDLRQVAFDDKGFVIIGVIGLSPSSRKIPLSQEELAYLAAKEIKYTYGALKLHASIGIATGMCHSGLAGDLHRAEYTVSGAPVNLAARLMGKALGMPTDSQVGLESGATILIDEPTRAGIRSESVDDHFVCAKVKVKGWRAAVPVFFPGDSLKAVDVQATINYLEDESSSVNVALGSSRALRRGNDSAKDARLSNNEVRAISSERARIKRENFQSHYRANLVDQISCKPGNEVLTEVVKYVAVMARISPWIHTSVLHASMKNSDFQVFDIDYALITLDSTYHVLQKVLDGLYIVPESVALASDTKQERDPRPSSDETKPAAKLLTTYKTFVYSYRAYVHCCIAKQYEVLGLSKDLDVLDINEVTALHYALAGEDYHLLAAECLNRSVLSGRHERKKSAELAKKSAWLVDSWNKVQRAKTEQVLAEPQFHMARDSHQGGDYRTAREGYIGVLMSYNALAHVLLSQPKNGKQNAVDAAPNLRDIDAVLFLHYVRDAMSYYLCFEAVHLRIVKGQVQLRRLKIRNMDNSKSMMRKKESSACAIERLTAKETAMLYPCSEESDASTGQALRRAEHFRVVTYNEVASRHLLLSLQGLSKLKSDSIHASREKSLAELGSVNRGSLISSTFEEAKSDHDGLRSRVGCILQ